MSDADSTQHDASPIEQGDDATRPAAPAADEGDAADDPPAASSDDATDGDETADRVDALAVELETLRAENRRLREEYRRARRVTYRRTALGLAGLGVLALALSAFVPSTSDVLLAIGATGLFGGLLVYYLTPEHLVTEAVPSSVIRVHTRTLEEMVDELGLQDAAVYVPRPDHGDVRLFVPQRSDYSVPDPDRLDDLFLVTDRDRRRGIALEPTGEPLYEEVREMAIVDGEDSLVRTVETLADALVEGFELAASVEPAVEEGRVVFSVTGGLAATGRGLDYPVSSVLATGLARHLERPVRAAIEHDDEATHVVCTWETGG